ncbi:MAG: hypothetical protein ABI432_17475 [Flavobacteriales bacterium]
MKQVPLLTFCATTALLALSSPVRAQDASPEGLEHSAYFELLGTGGAYSLNYELRYGIVAFRLGGETINGEGGTTRLWGVPASVLLLSNPLSNSTAEIGFGYTPTFGPRSYYRDEGTRYPTDLVTYDYDAFPTLQLGYRYQPREKPVIFRIDLTFLFLSEAYDKKGGYSSAHVQPWGGMSIGMCSDADLRCRTEPPTHEPPRRPPLRCDWDAHHLLWTVFCICATRL